MGHRGERDQAFHIGLSETAERSVDDADDCENADHRSPRFCTLREHRNCDTNKSVCTELQQNCGQNDRALRWRLSVSIRQPGMEREHRHFHCEADEHSGKDPDLHITVDQRPSFHEVRERERLGASLEEQRKEGHEHKGRSEHGVEEELQ